MNQTLEPPLSSFKERGIVSCFLEPPVTEPECLEGDAEVAFTWGSNANNEPNTGTTLLHSYSTTITFMLQGMHWLVLGEDTVFFNECFLSKESWPWPSTTPTLIQQSYPFFSCCITESCQPPTSYPSQRMIPSQQAADIHMPCSHYQRPGKGNKDYPTSSVLEEDDLCDKWWVYDRNDGASCCFVHLLRTQRIPIFGN